MSYYSRKPFAPLRNQFSSATGNGSGNARNNPNPRGPSHSRAYKPKPSAGNSLNPPPPFQHASPPSNPYQVNKTSGMPSFASPAHANDSSQIQSGNLKPAQVFASPGKSKQADQTPVSDSHALVTTAARETVSEAQLSRSRVSAQSIAAMVRKIIDMEVKLENLKILVQQTRPTKIKSENGQEFGESNANTPANKLTDLNDSITRIESRMRLLAPMIGLLTYINEVNLSIGSKNLYYTKVMEQRLGNNKFRHNLQNYYQCRVMDSGIVCPVLGIVVPGIASTAAHLFKHEWASVVDQVMGFTDINDVRNGLMLFSAIEEAFDNLRLCFYKNVQGNLVCWVLDPDIMNENMLDAAMHQMKNQGKQISDPDNLLARTYFYSLQDRPLLFQNQNRPYNRVLNFQARQAISNAIARQWITMEDAMERFVDYYSDGFDWDRKIKPWLDHQISIE